MRALVLWADQRSTNLGVRALADGAAALVRSAVPDASVEFQSFGRNGPAPIALAHPRTLLREWVTRRAGLADWFRQYDLVLDMRAGDSFADIYGPRRLRIMSAVAEFVHRAGVPLVLGPQTVGPFSGWQSTMLARRSLHTAALCMARDSVSAREAVRLRAPRLVETTDVVFALPQPPADGSRDVVLNVSGLLWQPGPHVDAQRYRAVVRELHDGLVRQGRTVSLLAHVLESNGPDDDVPAIRELAATSAPESEIIVPRSLDEVRSVLAGSTLVIGSRMHACLNALSVGTPAIPLAYSRKFEPLLGDLGWRHTVDVRSDDSPAQRVLAMAGSDGLSSDVALVKERAASSLQPAVEALKESW